MIKRTPKYRNFLFILLSLHCAIIYPEPTKAQEQFVLSNKKALEIWQDTNTILRQITYGKHLGETKKKDSARLLLYTALQNSKRLSFARGIQKALTNLANVYIADGKYDEAVALYEQTIAYCYRLPTLQSVLPPIHNNLANVYIKKGNYEQALHYYQQSVALYDKFKVKNNGEIYNNLGGLLIQLKRHSQSLYYLQKAEKAAIENKELAMLVNIYGNMGSYYFETGNKDSSLQFAYKALTIAKEYGFRQMQFNVLVNLGETYRRDHRPERAIPYLEQAIAMKGELSPFYFNHALVVLGNCYVETGNYPSGKKYLEEALKEAKRAGSKKHLSMIYAELSELSQNTGKYKESLEYYKLAKMIEDSIVQENIKKDLLEWDIQYRTAEKDKNIAEKQLEINMQKNELKSKNIWIFSTSAGLLLLASLFMILYAFYRISKHKSQRQEEQMQLWQKQQEIEQLQAIMTGEEKERKRMSQELHDGIGGMLAAIHMNLSSTEEKMKNKEEKHQIGQVLDMLQETSDEVRKTAHNLLPDILTRHSLEEALLIYCEQLNISNRLKIQFQYHVYTGNLEKSAELLLYRISQELLQNILKHAHATMAWLMIKELNNKLSIIVEDNGSGFDPSAQNQGYGLLNLQYRVKSLQGTLDIQSVAKRGTTIHIEFNMDKVTTKPA